MRGEGTTELHGFRELDETFYELGKALGKGVLRRVGTAALQPMAEKARAGVRERSGFLKKTIRVGTTLARSQRKDARATGEGPRMDPQNDVRVSMGPGQDPAAITEEFGKYNQAANPFMRPAWEAEAAPTIQRVATGLWPEIEKTAARRARRMAAASGG